MNRLHYLIITIVIVAFDIWTKALILARLELHAAVPVIENFFSIVHVRNTGAAFGIGANAESSIVPFLLNAGAIGVFIAVAIYAFRSPVSDRLLQLGLHLILGGAIGNLLDRFRFGYVVDFLDVYARWGGREHHWPAFNVADSAICVGIAFLFLDMRKKPEESRATAVESAS